LARSKPASAAEWAAQTENARRQSRYRAAEERIRRIVDGAPPLTAEQRARLAALLSPADSGPGRVMDRR
jgi:hypothetical protein